MQLVPPDRWRHVRSQDNPADCASHGLFPSELISHVLWWNSPDWLRLPCTIWPTQPTLPSETPAEEERDICQSTVVSNPDPVIPPDRFSSFVHLKRVTAWICRFINNCRRKREDWPMSVYLSTSELNASETYWLSFVQHQVFTSEIEALMSNEALPKSSRLFSLQCTSLS